MTITTIKVKELESRDRSANPGTRRILDSPFGPSIVYISIEDETMLDNLIERRNRPYERWKPIVEEALRDHGIKFEEIKWNQKAGCSMCPCSPGFVIKSGDIGRDIWITI